MCGAVKPLFALPFYFLRLLQGWKSLNQSKRAAASVDEFHQLCDSPVRFFSLKRMKFFSSSFTAFLAFDRFLAF